MVNDPIRGKIYLGMDAIGSILYPKDQGSVSQRLRSTLSLHGRHPGLTAVPLLLHLPNRIEKQSTFQYFD